jgi:hypothetical protein
MTNRCLKPPVTSLCLEPHDKPWLKLSQQTGETTLSAY